MADSKWELSMGQATDPAYGIVPDDDEGFAVRPTPEHALPEVPDHVWDGPAGYAVSDDEDASDYDSDDADMDVGFSELDGVEADVSDMVEAAEASDGEGEGEEDDDEGYAARRRKRGQSLTLHTASGKRMRARRTGDKTIEWTVVHRKVSGKPVEAKRVTTSSTQSIGKNLSKIVDSFTAEEKLITRPRHFFKHRTAKSVLTSVSQRGATVRVQVLNMFTGAVKELSHRAKSEAKAARIAKRLRGTLSKAKAWKSVAHGDVVRTVLKKRTERRKKKQRKMSEAHSARTSRRRGGGAGYAATGAGEEGFAAKREGRRFAEDMVDTAREWSCLGMGQQASGDESANNPVARMLSLANAVDHRFKLREEMKLIRIDNLRVSPASVLGTKGSDKTVVTPDEDLDGRVHLASGLLVYMSACHMVADNYDLDLDNVKERPPPINVDKEAEAAMQKINMAMDSGLKTSVEAAQLQANRMVRTVLSELSHRSSESAMSVLARKLRWICDVCSAILAKAYNNSLKVTLAAVRSIVSQHGAKWGVSYGIHNLGDGLVAVFAETALVARPLLTMQAEDVKARKATTSLVAAVATKLKTEVGDADFIRGINRSVFNKAPSMSVMGLLAEQMNTVSAGAATTMAILLQGSGMDSTSAGGAMSRFIAELKAVLLYIENNGSYADVAKAAVGALEVEGGASRSARGYAAADDSDDESQPSMDEGVDLDGYAVGGVECPFGRGALNGAIAAYHPDCPPFKRVDSIYGTMNGNPQVGRVDDDFLVQGTNAMGNPAFAHLKVSHGGGEPCDVKVVHCDEGAHSQMEAYRRTLSGPMPEHVSDAVIPGF